MTGKRRTLMAAKTNTAAPKAAAERRHSWLLKLLAAWSDNLLQTGEGPIKVVSRAD